MSRGLISADLNAGGKVPEVREELNKAVSGGRRASTHSIRSGVGMGSRAQLLGEDLKMTDLTNARLSDSLEGGKRKTVERCLFRK